MKIWLMSRCVGALAVYSSLNSSPQTFLAEISRESVILSHPANFQTYALHFPTNTIEYQRAPSSLIINYDSLGDAFHVHAMYSDRSGEVDVVEIKVLHIDPTPITRPILPLLPALSSDGSLEKAAESSFIAKYWFYLLPILIIMLLGGSGEEEAKGPRR